MKWNDVGEREGGEATLGGGDSCIYIHSYKGGVSTSLAFKVGGSAPRSHFHYLTPQLMRRYRAMEGFQRSQEE